MSFSKVCAALIALGSLMVLPSRAVILDSTGDPNFNTTAPSGTLAGTGSLVGSGWQYEGTWGGFLGTAIAPNYFITAEHVGGNIGDTFTLDGNNYTTTAVFDDPNTDLRIWQVNGTFSSYAPLYTGTNEVNKNLVVIGRGTERGAAITSNNITRGWGWGAGTQVQRWGTNKVATTFDFGGGLGDMLIADFDHGASSTEADLSSGDSGGAVFIKDTDGIWKLAGINYAVDGPFYTSATGDGAFFGALYETSGFYAKTNAGTYIPVTGPSSFYASRISSSLSFINSVVPPAPVPEPTVTSSLFVLLSASALRYRGSRHRN